MHNGMTLTRIQGQGQGHRDPKSLAEVDRQSAYGNNFYLVVFSFFFADVCATHMIISLMLVCGMI